MCGRLRRPIASLCIGLLMVFPVAAQTPSSLLPDATPSAEPEPVLRWLDEVRAQRRMWQERRRAVKEVIDARRRAIDPWGAARQERREQETQRRHDALLEHVERDREAFRNRVPWGFRQGPWQEEAPASPATSSRPDAADAAETAGPATPQATPYPLPGWNNHWYYRGF